MEGPSARALAVRPVEVDGRMKRGGQTGFRPHAGAVNKPSVQRRRGIAPFTLVVGAAAGDVVGSTVPAEVVAPNLLITPPTNMLLADLSSGADELLKPFTWDLENPNADFGWLDADFACLEGDVEFD